jgi:hypothetical protein
MVVSLVGFYPLSGRLAIPLRLLPGFLSLSLSLSQFLSLWRSRVLPICSHSLAWHHDSAFHRVLLISPPLETIALHKFLTLWLNNSSLFLSLPLCLSHCFTSLNLTWPLNDHTSILWLTNIQTHSSSYFIGLHNTPSFYSPTISPSWLILSSDPHFLLFVIPLDFIGLNFRPLALISQPWLFLNHLLTIQSHYSTTWLILIKMILVFNNNIAKDCITQFFPVYC